MELKESLCDLTNTVATGFHDLPNSESLKAVRRIDLETAIGLTITVCAVIGAVTITTGIIRHVLR